MANNPKLYQFNLPSIERPDDLSIPEKWYPGIKNYWKKSTSTRIYNPIDGIRAVVIHATAGSSSSGAISVMKKGKSSFHWLVPGEEEPQHGKLIWSCVPESLAAWHVRGDKSHTDVWDGHKKINHWSLGIEVVNSQKTSDLFSDWQVMITAQIVRYCWCKYPNLVHVVSHAKLDPSRRSDPGGNFPWHEFKNQVLHDDNDDLGIGVFGAINADEITDRATAGCCVG